MHPTHLNVHILKPVKTVKKLGMYKGSYCVAATILKVAK